MTVSNKAFATIVNRKEKEKLEEYAQIELTSSWEAMVKWQGRRRGMDHKDLLANKVPQSLEKEDKSIVF